MSGSKFKVIQKWFSFHSRRSNVSNDIRHKAYMIFFVLPKMVTRIVLQFVFIERDGISSFISTSYRKRNRETFAFNMATLLYSKWRFLWLCNFKNKRHWVHVWDKYLRVYLRVGEHVCNYKHTHVHINTRFFNWYCFIVRNDVTMSRIRNHKSFHIDGPWILRCRIGLLDTPELIID